MCALLSSGFLMGGLFHPAYVGKTSGVGSFRLVKAGGMNCHRLPVLLGFLLLALAASVRADFAFTHNGHAYTLVTAAKSWENAQADAVARGGTLARIDDAAENTAILTNLMGRGITTTASDGGNAIYVWIGGQETVEGSYAWINKAGAADPFWAGGKNGSAQNGLFANWGRNTLGAAGPEPDNFNGTQNRTGFALEAWPKSGTTKIGQAGEWNDINGTDMLAYLVERAPPNAPSNLVITVTGRNNLILSWYDNSDDEIGFLVGFRPGTSGEFSLLSSLPPNSTSLPVGGAAEASTFQFFVEAWNDVGAADSAMATVTMPGITSRGFHPAVVNQPFSYSVTASSHGGAPDSVNVTGVLPAGLAFNSTTHQITGAPLEAGVFEATISVHYPAWGSYDRPFTLRVIHPSGPPIALASIPNQALAAGEAEATVSLNDHFLDRDTEQAVRFVTSKGTFDVALYAAATPQTVSNFLNYVDRGDYGNSIIHRAKANFVVQGGGFKPAPPDFTRIPTDPSPINEPGIQHVRGTVSLAKMGGNPNSATDQWFINLKDNSAELDDQNGGFAAFGRVCGNCMDVADAINALPRGSYTVNIDGLSAAFQDWPMNTTSPAPAVMDQSKLVLTHSVTRIEPLAYTVTGNTAAEFVAASIRSTNLVLVPTGLFGGTGIVTVTATDLDGNSFSQPLTVEVASAYGDWTGLHQLGGPDAMPDADTDNDLLPNVVEFVLMGSPNDSDRASSLPAGSFVSVALQQHAALTFKLRKDLSGVSVVMEASAELSPGSWVAVWNNTELDSNLEVQRVDRGDHWLITVRDPASFSHGTQQHFLRLRVVAP